MLNVGDTAPDFTLQDQHGSDRSLGMYAGQWVLLYFYPKDDTPGCTKEACGLQSRLTGIKKLKAEVLGVSKDSVKSHQKFAKRYKLEFPLLADEETKVCQAYGVWQEKTFMGKKYMGILRASFLIDPKGKIAKVYPEVNPEEHAGEIMDDLKALQR
ncbi:MAG: thioredoxin-dependent thiol peroxidase [Candidatus Peribacteraceae bacterium]|nr:thioredoxin-dependent thiol peroxidase [Candidatus Peribacteraceae bacterium]